MTLRTAALLVIALWLTASLVFVTQYLRDSRAAPDHWARGELQERLVLQSIALNFPASLIAVAIAPYIPIAGVRGEWALLSLAGLGQWVLFFYVLQRIPRRERTV